MTIQVTWENSEKTLLRFAYLTAWTWDALYNAAIQANTMMDEAESPIVSILDYSQGGAVPSGMPVHFRSILRLTNSKNNSGINIVLAGKFGNIVARSYISLMEKLAPETAKNSKWIIANTLEEAQKLAQEKANELKNI